MPILNMYFHMTVLRNIHVNILILYEATCIDFKEVIVRSYSEHENVKLQCRSAHVLL
jgi:hypothetical protein